MNKEQVLVISLENKLGQGEDFQIAEDYEQAIVIGVFDGLGGRILGTAKETGGRIASRKVAEITKFDKNLSKQTIVLALYWH